MRYVLECDDGNNIPNDGCDTSCNIEPGYICRGGSPNSADTCIVYSPSAVTLVQTGQVRYTTKIMINVKLDYMPLDLIQSSACNDRCSEVLVANIVQGESGARIKSSYIAGSRYAFSIMFEFDRSYIAQFTVEIAVNPTLGSRYFSGVSIDSRLVVDVNPAFMAGAEEEDTLL